MTRFVGFNIAAFVLLNATPVFADVRCMSNLANFAYCKEGYSAFDSAKVTVNFDQALGADFISEDPFVAFMIAELPSQSAQWNDEIALAGFLDIVTTGERIANVYDLEITRSQIGPYSTTRLKMRLGEENHNYYLVDALAFVDRHVFLTSMSDERQVGLRNLADYHAVALRNLRTIPR